MNSRGIFSDNDERTDKTEFRVIFHVNYDNSIIMQKADNTFLSLNGLSESDTGKNIHELFCKSECERIRYYAENYIGHSFHSRYLHEFSEINYSLWDVEILIHHPVIEFHGKILISGDKKYSDHSIPEKEDFFFAVLSRSSGSLSVNLCSDNITGFITDIIYNRYPDITELIVRSFETGNEYTVTKIDSMLFPNKRGVKLHIIPFTQARKRKILLNVTFGDSLSYLRYNMQNTAEDICEKLIGCALVDCSSEKAYFTDLNSYFASLISQRKITGKDLTGSYLFRSSTKNCISDSGKIISSDSNNTYLTAAIPIIKNGLTVRSAVFVFPCDEHETMDTGIFEHLTAKEGAVLRLVAMGQSGKEISSSLKISDGTVKKELYSCYKKLGVDNRIGVIKKLYRLI